MANVLTLRGRVLQSRDAVELLSDKWRVAILHALEVGPQRTGQVHKALKEVSSKVLTQTLRGMERDGLISRAVFSVIPPRVEYALTPMGRSLIVPLRELCHWAKAHVAERDRARKHFDARPDPRAS
jgi:DNA-binding HxlR family transcriptional regulator